MLSSKGLSIFFTWGAVFLSSSCSYLSSKEAVKNDSTEIKSKAPLTAVGHISFDPDIDDSDYKICYPDYVWIYSPFDGVGFEGEKPALVEVFKDQFIPRKDVESSGYITIRFIVNCEGKAGRFRLIQLNEEYEISTNIDKEVVDQIYRITKSLTGWSRHYYEGNYYDYHQYLTFKIKNGDIIEYLP